jgi:hypothetical protein
MMTPDKEKKYWSYKRQTDQRRSEPQDMPMKG